MNLLRKLAIVIVLFSPMAANADPTVQSAPCENNANLLCATGILGLDIRGAIFDVEFIVDSYDAVYGDMAPMFFGDPLMATLARNAILGAIAWGPIASRYAGPIGDGVIGGDAILVPYLIYSSGTRNVASACAANQTEGGQGTGTLEWVGRSCAGGRTEVFSGDKYWAYTRFTKVPELVTIDIKPGSDPNCFNANGHGVIPVAILGSASFDVTYVDQATLLFGGLKVRVRGSKGPLCSLEDSNGDGFLDMVCQFEDNADYWTPGDGDATLTGKLYDETTEFEGTDSLCIVP